MNDIHRPEARGRGERRAILFIGGSLNQTTMMHRIARELESDHCCRFAPFWADGWVGRLAAAGALDFTILGGQARAATLRYLEAHGLEIDERGSRGDYDLVVTCTDLILQRGIRDRPIVLVQEGMTEPEDYRYRLVRALRLPRYLANTSVTGLSHGYEAFCVASPGYRDHFVAKGVDPARIRVTGIPNFDDARAYLDNDFPHRGHLLVATSCLRETFRLENRKALIERARRLADGRPLIFKLHPNERVDRARREIERHAPEATVYANGEIGPMIANAEALLTRYSSVVFIAAALGKEVHSDLPAEMLHRLLPLQNGGTSARRIAEVCREILDREAPNGSSGPS